MSICIHDNLRYDTWKDANKHGKTQIQENVFPEGAIKEK